MIIKYSLQDRGFFFLLMHRLSRIQTFWIKKKLYLVWIMFKTLLFCRLKTESETFPPAFNRLLSNHLHSGNGVEYEYPKWLQIWIP